MSPDALILFAEDDENDVLLFRMALRKAGILNPVAHARDGEDALNYLSGAGSYSDRTQHPFPAIVFTDLKMPKLTGFEVLTWIRNQVQVKILPAIVLSGSEEELDKRRAFALGATAYWEKPTELADLVRLVHGVKLFLTGSP
jgi:CheY-like chemotaxis protein